MEILKSILLIIYLISFVYCSYELIREMVNWYKYGNKDFLLFKAIFLSIIAVTIPVCNTVIAVLLIKHNNRLNN